MKWLRKQLHAFPRWGFIQNRFMKGESALILIAQARGIRA